MKVKIIATAADADAILERVAASANRALEKLREVHSGSDAMMALWQMKVGPTGCDPLDPDTSLNLIEQLNQTFTYMASALAVRTLLALHPEEAPFTLNLGTTAGLDIESMSGAIAAEVFAAVNPRNNRKLAKDIAKVAASSAREKYVFFMCPGFAEGPQPTLGNGSGVSIWSVGTALLDGTR
ncbi:MAG: hypothetical protein KDI51_18485 [Xanthomonadales bacterium]|nr:hypothetical protein [Xanthomonadales bacterium]